jgi:uncharacterized surface protein with fasciclin (FAS1) repeats
MLDKMWKIGVASALALVVASPAMASGFDRKEFKEFIKCAFTRKVKVDATIWEVADSTEGFETLALLVEEAGLIPVLDGPGPFTVYAPTNDAFGALPAELVGFLLANPTTDLTSVLTYHVTPGQGRKLDPRRAIVPTEVETAQPDGQTVFYNRGDGVPQVNNSNVACQGVQASNGTIWVIDSVLMPQYLQTPAE